MATKATDEPSSALAPLRPGPPRAWWPASAWSAFSVGDSSMPPCSTRRQRGLAQHFSRSSSVFLAMKGRRRASSRSSRSRSYSLRKLEASICVTDTPLLRNMTVSSSCCFFSFHRCVSVRPEAILALQSTTPNFISSPSRCATASTESGSGVLSLGDAQATAHVSPLKKTLRSMASSPASRYTSGLPPPPESMTSTANVATAAPPYFISGDAPPFFLVAFAVPPQSSTAAAAAPPALF
mmetsp:Transcript_27957/g.83783  ORF Transcript_27957/g.83783 Transcript_27957/m.83783 type:complete len:238 (+) Transcript_27957:545-1258(+)